MLKTKTKICLLFAVSLIVGIIIRFYCTNNTNVYDVLYYKNQDYGRIYDSLTRNDSNNISHFIAKYTTLNASNNSWHKYRLGDMFRNRNMVKSQSWGFKYHKEQFPDSIATQYLSYSNGTRLDDINLLFDIVQNRSITANISHNYEETVIVHLRTGDVIDDSPLNIKQMLSSGIRINQYIKQISYYMKSIDQLKLFNLSNALFISGFHKGHNHTKSLLYISAVMRLFQDNGYSQTNLRMNGNPDDDFLIMSNSKYFIRSGGGFSTIAAVMATMNGGNVYPCIKRMDFCLDSHCCYGKHCFYCK